MGCHCHPGALSCLATVLATLQVALAVSIALVVRQCLWVVTTSVTWAPSSWEHTSSGDVCLLSTGSANLCAYTYAVVAVSLLASLAMVCLQCCSARRRCCASLEACLAVLLVAWWAGAATTATVYGTSADSASPPLPRSAARTSVWAMGWAQCGLWALSAAVACACRRAARHRALADELSVSLSNSKQGAAGAASKYHRFHDDSPFADKGKGGGSAQSWRAARSEYLARSSPASAAAQPASKKQLDP